MVRCSIVVVMLGALVLGGCCCRRACVAAAPRPIGTAPPGLEAPGQIAPREAAPAVAEAPPVAEAQKRLTPDEKLVEMLIRKRIKGLQWDEASLATALTYLSTITGVQHSASPKVLEEKSEDISISLALDDVSLSTVLNLITEQNAMRWEAREGVVWLFTTEETDGPIKLRYFDLKDLIRPEGEHGFASMDDAVATIQENVFRKLWNRGQSTLEGRNGILIARASRAVHDAIGRFLDEERNKLAKPGLSPELQAKFQATKVTLSVKDQTLADVIRALQVQTGLNLTIDSRIASDVASVLITQLQMQDEPLTHVLEVLAVQAGEDTLWVSRQGVAVLTRRELAGWRETGPR